MRNRLGKTCTVLGILCVIAALMLVAWNEYESYRAEAAANRVLSQMLEDVRTTRGISDPYDTEMTEKEIDGVRYVGYLAIPSMDLELPVISESNDANLKKAPCRYYGSSKSDDLVIAAHNFRGFFGGLGSLKGGDAVYFTDMDGVTTAYEVVETEVLNPTAVEDMIAGEYALTLFTCTYGGKTRITVRCEEKKRTAVRRL